MLSSQFPVIIISPSDKIKRELNQLRETDPRLHKSALCSLLSVFQTLISDSNISDLQNLFNESQLLVVECFNSKSDSVRESAAKIIDLLFSKVVFAESFLQYLIQQIVERSNCFSLDNFDNLPEEARPTPSTLPTIMVSQIEKVEEIRLLLLSILEQILQCSEPVYIVRHLNDLVNILRVFMMDPELAIQTRACQIAADFINVYNEELINFSDRIARSLLLSLVSQKSRVKLAGLRTLEQLMFVGPWKQSYAVMDLLIGFRDPNSVAIKEFYESGFKLNYLALLINDNKRQVRETLLNILENWFINLKDKEDHHPRLICYLLTFLFDVDDDLREQAVDVLQQIGKINEREKEDKFRAAKQNGVDSNWCAAFKTVDSLGLFPFESRPRVGTRFLVQCNLSKIMPAIKRELKDSINPANRLRTLQLLKYLAYLSEEAILEFIPGLILNFIRNLKLDRRSDIQTQIELCCELFGRFCGFKNVFLQLKGFLTDSDQSEGNLLPTIIILRAFLKGHLDPEMAGKSDFGNRADDFRFVVDFLESIDLELHGNLDATIELDKLFGLILKIRQAHFGEFGNNKPGFGSLAQIRVKLPAMRLWREIHGLKIDSSVPFTPTRDVLDELSRVLEVRPDGSTTHLKSETLKQLATFGFRMSLDLDLTEHVFSFQNLLVGIVYQSDKMAANYELVYLYFAKELGKKMSGNIEAGYQPVLEVFFEFSAKMIESAKKEVQELKDAVLSAHLRLSKSYFDSIAKNDKNKFQTSQKILETQKQLLKCFIQILESEKKIGTILIFKDYLLFFCNKFSIHNLSDSDLLVFLRFARNFATRISFVEETSAHFEGIIFSVLALLAALAKIEQQPENKVGLETTILIDEVFRIYWSLQSELMQIKLKTGIISYFKKRPLFLTKLIQDSEQVGKIRKFEFLKELFKSVIA